MQTDDAVAYCKNTIKSLRKAQERFDALMEEHPDGTMPKAAIDSWLVYFMELFPSVAFKFGWRLAAKYHHGGIGGELKLFVKGPLGLASRNVCGHVRLTGDSDEAALDLALFNYARTQIGLFWHALYERREFITDIKEFAENYRFHFVRWATITRRIKDMDAFLRYDFSPRVRQEGNGQRVVEYSTFSPFAGFERNVVRIDGKAPVGNPGDEVDVVFPYSCGLHF